MRDNKEAFDPNDTLRYLFVVLVFSFPNMVVEEREERGGEEGERRREAED